MGTVKILNQTLKAPLSFMGQCAGIAYDSDTVDYQKCYKRGLSCVKDGHYRMLEFCDIYFELEGYSIRVIREFMRHVGDGLTVIQRSTRYCNEGESGYYIPPAIQKDEESSYLYNNAIGYSLSVYRHLVDECGIKKEDAAGVLPLNLSTTLAVKHNARTMMNMAEQRLCSRTYVEFRQLMRDFLVALSEYSEEWNILCAMIMKCKCVKVGWCEEHQSCGRYPKKEDTVVVPIEKDSNPNEFDS